MKYKYIVEQEPSIYVKIFMACDNIYKQYSSIQ